MCKNETLISKLIIAIIFFSFVSFSIDGFAANGKISGRVFDKETKQPLAGANVFIESIWQFGKEVKLEMTLGAASDVDGYFVILNVPPATYNIKASMMGYDNLVVQRIRVNIDRTTTVDFALEPKVIEMGEIQVMAEREIIKPDVSGTQEIIISERIAEAPVLRVDEFINKIKGVELVAGSDGHGLSIRGGAIRETDVRIDGISVHDPRSENSY